MSTLFHSLRRRDVNVGTIETSGNGLTAPKPITQSDKSKKAASCSSSRRRGTHSMSSATRMGLMILMALVLLLYGMWWYCCFKWKNLPSRLFPNNRGAWHQNEDVFLSPAFRLLMLVLDQLHILSLSSSTYAVFSDYRTGLFGNNYLGENAQVQAGPTVAIRSTSLSPEGLQQHLQKVTDTQQTSVSGSSSRRDQWYYTPHAKLRQVLLDNERSLEARLAIAQTATSSIWITTWALEDSDTTDRLAAVLLAKARAGVDVRVLVDSVYWEYLQHREILANRRYTQVLWSLVQGGVSVRRIETWLIPQDDDEVVVRQPQGYSDHHHHHSYVIGSHRKMMLVDDRILLTGGRNISDEYFKSTAFHFRDAEVVLEGDDFAQTTAVLLQELWDQAKDMKDDSENVRNSGHSTPSARINPPLMLTEEKNSLEHRQTQTSSETVSTHNISLFQLDHCAGNPEGHDIIFSTLLYLLETAEDRIDLLFGYFQLFPALEQALKRATDRGVKIRLVTNSEETTDLAFFNKVYREALERLLELGAEIQMGVVPAANNNGDADYCLHYKIVMVDRKAVMIGSWNCLGVSVFHDDEFSVVMFENEHNSTIRVSGIFDRHVAEMAREGRLEGIESLQEGAFEVSRLFTTFASKNGIRQMNRGF